MGTLGLKWPPPPRAPDKSRCQLPMNPGRPGGRMTAPARSKGRPAAPCDSVWHGRACLQLRGPATDCMLLQLPCHPGTPICAVCTAAVAHSPASGSSPDLPTYHQTKPWPRPEARNCCSVVIRPTHNPSRICPETRSCWMASECQRRSRPLSCGTPPTIDRYYRRECVDAVKPRTNKRTSTVLSGQVPPVFRLRQRLRCGANTYWLEVNESIGRGTMVRT